MTARKPPDRRHNTKTKDVVVELVPGPTGPTVPASPDRWLEETESEWDAFWLDDQLVSVVRDTHKPALVRLFDWRDRLRRAWDQADELREAVGDEHFVAGSTGQVRANPLYERAEKAEALALQIEGRVEAMEDRFGLTPGSLLKLGVSFQKKQNLEQLNAALAKGVGRDGNDVGPAPHDPRALPRDTATGSA